MTNSNLPFEKGNYTLMLVGIAVLIIGFAVMASETAEFGFGFLGLTLAPLMLIAGFTIEFFAIFYKGKSK